MQCVFFNVRRFFTTPNLIVFCWHDLDYFKYWNAFYYNISIFALDFLLSEFIYLCARSKPQPQLDCVCVCVCVCDVDLSSLHSGDWWNFIRYYIYKDTKMWWNLCLFYVYLVWKSMTFIPQNPFFHSTYTERDRHPNMPWILYDYWNFVLVRKQLYAYNARLLSDFSFNVLHWINKRVKDTQ